MGVDIMTLDQVVSEDNLGRLDTIAASLLGCSRSMAATAICAGYILVNGEKRRPAYSVKMGDHISGDLSLPASSPIPEAIPMDLNILFEDDDVLVVNKPVGMVVHPGAGNASDTLVNGLLAHYPDIADVGDDPLRPGIVHRLDKDTSGLLVVAKNQESLSFLQNEFSCRRVKKWYLALVWGNDLSDTGEIHLPIGRHKIDRKRMAVDHDRGREARTSWEVVQRFKNNCLVRIRLYTGRTHQIRVHFHAMGYPLVGDPVYGFRRKYRSVPGIPSHQMLHAQKLSFCHPGFGKLVTYESPMPEIWNKVMAGL